MLYKPYTDLIYAHNNRIVNIRKPLIKGYTESVFLGDTDTDTFVYRFKNAETLSRNVDISKTLVNHNIPVPKTNVFSHNGISCEYYKYSPDKTLHEKISNGLSDDKIFKIYCDILKFQHQINKIPLSEFSSEYNLKYHHVLKMNMHDRNIPIPGILSLAVYPVANISTQKLFHTDLHPGNILIDKDMHISKILDIDAFTICNETWAMLRLLCAYPLKNYNELFDFYENLEHHQVNRKILSGLLPILKTAQKYYNHTIWSHQR